MGKKKSFIDKKKAATFSLVFRDSSDAAAGDDSAPERIFVRSDGRDEAAPGFDGTESQFEGGSEFALEDGLKDFRGFGPAHPLWAGPREPLPEHVRREVLEMGFPDDGYDYTKHLRELRGGGVGAIAVAPERNLRADVRAYNAKTVRVKPAEEDEILAEAEAAGGAKEIQKVGASVLDPDILKLLEESGSEDGGDEELELEDDFVIEANRGAEEENGAAEGFRIAPRGALGNGGAVQKWLGSSTGGKGFEVAEIEEYEEWSEEEEGEEDDAAAMKGRGFAASSIASDVRNRDRPVRLLDEQFENLAVREYDLDDDSDEEDVDARGHADISQFDSVLDSFLEDHDVHPDEYHTLAEVEKGGKQRTETAPTEETGGLSRKSNVLSGDVKNGAVGLEKETMSSDRRADGSPSAEAGLLEAASTSGREAEVVEARTNKTSGKGRGLDEVSDGGADEEADVLGELREEKEVIWVEEEDEREHWDCDTIVSTYSNLDNHPARIGAPPNKFKSLGSERGSQREENLPGLIRLGGKEGLPIEYLPRRGGLEGLPERPSGKENEEDEKRGPSQKVAGPRAGEGKEEKKARKAAVKEQRRESRVVKRDMKALYKAEAQKAINKAAAAAGAPQGIRLA
ncbi:hypothetical protein KFL_000060390 [Klebsormidium nitens]|uniref:Low temperature viability protein n=1 Tax=Klebsormidium nitens TaxID=105231 RepID=A0A0U9HI91_KLENI|nr:hypothetical protein KFL_000060390 [Klebsormidium nitens]|eukprot:GAQ77974.1 hypothetical protein KFL_000060390 [Klebsormidium nitens]